MNHTAPSAFPISDLLARRWSPVAFTARAISDNELHMLFEASRWAPSSFNEQPWRIIYARKGDEHHAKLCALLTEGNAWAKEAPLLGLFVAKKLFARNSKPNRHAQHDCGSAMLSLFLQATAMGLQGHGMAGFDVEKARKEYGISEDYEPITMFGVGEHDDSPTRDADKMKREEQPRTRNEQAAFAFHGTWNA